MYAEADPVGFGPLCLAFLSYGRALSGDGSGAAQALADAETSLRPGIRIFHSDLGLARAWTAAAGGDLAAARAQAARVAEAARAHGHAAYAGLAFHELVRLGDASAATGPLFDLADSLDGRLPPAYAAHAAALADADGGALDRAAAAFETAGAQLLAPEAWAEASAAHRAAGRFSRALRSAARSRLIAEQCDGAPTPALARAGQAAALTRRERDLVSLAASGLSNRAIAERFVV